jgi:hypothetical protein
VALVGASAPAQTVIFNHNFNNAPAPGTAVTSAASLGAPVTGTMSFSGPAVGGIGGGANPALAVATNFNTTTLAASTVPNMTAMAEAAVTFGTTYPDTQIVDAGLGDRVLANFASPGSFTGGQRTEVNFNLAGFGTSNTGNFKYQFVRGLSPTNQEVFELLFVNGSAANTRAVYARGATDDQTTQTSASVGAPEGTLLANNFSDGLSGTSVSGGVPAGMWDVDIVLENGQVSFNIGATVGTLTAAPANNTFLAINSAATQIAKLEFSSAWTTAIAGQNRGYWIDNLFALTVGGGVFPEGDVNLDGFVTIDDFNVIAGNFKTSVASRSQGDLNADGFVDFADFRIWKTASGGSTALAVPEPAAGAIALCVALMGLSRRRR